jgi:hypothetical protein
MCLVAARARRYCCDDERDRRHDARAPPREVKCFESHGGTLVNMKMKIIINKD